MIKIKNIKLKNNIVVAPMAGITDKVFNNLIAKFNPGLIYSEMISAKAFCLKSKKTIKMLYAKPKHVPFSIQLFGDNKEEILECIKFIKKRKLADIVDINMGCPVDKVTNKSKSGSYLLKTPNKIYEIISFLKNNIDFPLTIKIRSGWDDKSINFLEIGKLAEHAGVDAIAFHPRTREQGYSGKANWEQIKLLKQHVNVPIIGNGDIITLQDGRKMLEQTNCDAIMIGRGIIGNPWLISEIIMNKKINVSFKTKYKYILLHLKKLVKEYGIKHGIQMFRTYISFYLKGYKNCNKTINNINNLKTYSDVKKELKNFLLISIIT